MPATVIIDLCFGDSGKGKCSHYLAPKFDAGVRFNGGDNAGHTIITDDNKKFITHLVPASLLLDKPSFISPGVLINPEVLSLELHKNDLDESLLTIDPNCPVITEQHLQKDLETGVKVGTTGRGIGPCMSDQVNRTGIRVRDYLKNGGILEGTVDNTGKKLRALLKQGKNILFEGAQGHFLDLWHGTYPYVTSSACTVGAVCTNAGIPPQEINRVIGVFKAYSTRVGNGPFRTEITTLLADQIREVGKEYGSTTGRPRRIGWLDLEMIREACQINGVTELIITKADIFSELCNRNLSNIINVAYRSLHNGQPKYQQFETWKDLYCKQFLKFISFVEDYLQVPIKHISSGPKTSDMIIV